MPKRQTVNLPQIADWQNLVEATYSAAKSKRDRPAVKVFLGNLEESLQAVRACILRAELYQGSYRSFSIKDPKPRIIHAAPFADRVIHHALIAQIGERLEKSWVDSSYACRKNYGSHKAIEKAAALCERYPIVVKLDIRAYFAHINHKILLDLLARQLKGNGVLRLVENILDSFTNNGFGIPIGSLTSQYFANHYLDGYQRWLRKNICVKAEIRYMDDVLLFCDSLSKARQVVAESREWLSDERKLTLKPAIIQQSRIGVTFCGFKVNAAGIRMGQRRKRSYQQQLKQMFVDVRNGELVSIALQNKACQLAALCSPGEHQNWQSAQLKKLMPEPWSLEF